MEKTAIVLSGGGALGALQAGALQAIVEINLQPDLVIGTSIGAINAACLAIYGFDRAGVKRLEETWLEAAEARLLPGFDLRHNIADWMVYFRGGYGSRIRDFFMTHGIQSDLTFGQLEGVKVMFVAADLNSGGRVVYGLDPDQLVLEGMLASAAIPPWVYPLHVREYYLADGGFVSNLPVETALEQGAARIITLELNNPPSLAAQPGGIRPFLARVFNTVEKRQSELELALAEARGIPVFRIPLTGGEKYTFWDFRFAQELMQKGCEQALREICSPAGLSFFEKERRTIENTAVFQPFIGGKVF